MAGTKQSGRRRAPTALTVLRGNPGQGKLNKKEPKYAKLVNIEPPKFLDAEAQTEWRRLSPALCAQGLLSEADCATFGAYCSAYSDWVRAGLKLQESGDLQERLHTVGLSPVVKMKREAEAAMVRWAREFGFTPASRTGIVTPVGNDPVDEFTAWMEKGK